jgi:hypothetical protein
VETQTQNLLPVKEVMYHQTSSWVKKHVAILKFDAFKLKNINMHIFFQILKITPFLVSKRPWD